MAYFDIPGLDPNTPSPYNIPQATSPWGGVNIGELLKTFGQRMVPGVPGSLAPALAGAGSVFNKIGAGNKPQNQWRNDFSNAVSNAVSAPSMGGVLNQTVGGGNTPTGPQPVKTKKVTTEEQHFPERGAPAASTEGTIQQPTPAAPVGPRRVPPVSALPSALAGYLDPTEGVSTNVPVPTPATPTGTAPIPEVSMGGNIADMITANPLNPGMAVNAFNQAMAHAPAARIAAMKEGREQDLHPLAMVQKYQEALKTEAEKAKLEQERINLTEKGARAYANAKKFGEVEAEFAAKMVIAGANAKDPIPQKYRDFFPLPPSVKTIGDAMRIGLWDNMQKEYAAWERQKEETRGRIGAASVGAAGMKEAARITKGLGDLALATAEKIRRTTFSPFKPDGTPMTPQEIQSAALITKKNPRTAEDQDLLDMAVRANSDSIEASSYLSDKAAKSEGAPNTAKGQERRSAAGKVKLPKGAQTGTYKGTRAYTTDGKTFYDMKGKRLN